MIIIQVLVKLLERVRLKRLYLVSLPRYLPNGNLVISGERTVDVNNDSEIIQISGIVRPADIDIKNTVESYQVAQFNISLKGKGVVSSKQTPGFLSNFFNWVF